VSRAARWSVFSSLPQPLLAVPAYLFVEAFRPALPVGLGFAGGAMVWMVFSELMPEALDDADHVSVGVTVTISLVLMIAAQMWLRG
jgi:zinc transporter ZupT